jgi:hypothetical protein
MKNFNRINTIVGFIVLIFATTVYAMTMESSGSFWDCGEFVSGCFKLQVVHAPGAPFFLMLGRLFSLLAMGDTAKVALMVNFMSAFSTAASIMFCYWSVVLLAKKVFFADRKNPTTGEAIAVMGAGFIAAASATFLDSLWFSAVEGEVYALSQFFMAIIVWAILKWEESESEYADRWIIFIAYMVGLSIGVHLLSLLALPFIAIVYYFKRHKFSLTGMLISVVAGFAILGFAMKFVISYTQAFMAGFDKFFVNSLGLPFYSGVAFFFLLLISLLAYGIWYSQQKGKYYLNLGLISAAFVYIGYLSYAMVPIRSMANTPINMNAPKDPYSIKSYVDREQYGDRPLVYGPDYTATYDDIIAQNETGDRFYKGDSKYEFAGKKMDYKFRDEVCMLFPRLGFWQETSKHDGYRAWLNPGCKIVDRKTDQVVQVFESGMRQQANQIAEQRNAEEPSRYIVKDDISMGDNIWYFLKYQLGFMYFRYFMWNFSGRQDDAQGTYYNDNGRWISGISFIDNSGLFFTPENPQTDLSKDMLRNKGRNKFYMIPFILGLIGLIYTLYRNEEIFLKIFVLFLVTGIFQIVYQNEPPIEPRERDYALAGSFWTYCFWIGFGVLAIWDFLRKKIAEVPASAVALALSVSAPILMGAQGWDDHTRHNRFTARDLALDYLESCQPNAILFTMGDNDTYPLWYAQEVEGIRTDVRVINLSLLGVDWYVKQLKHKWNNAPAVKTTFTDAQINASNRDVIRYAPAPGIPEGTPIDLRKVMQFIASEDTRNKVSSGRGEMENYLPTKNFYLDFDTNMVKQMNMLDPANYNEITGRMNWEISSGTILKNDLMTLDIVASNIYERPIYFAVSVSSEAYLGMDKYFQLEGLTYRIVPRESGSKGHSNAPLRNDLAYKNMLTKFKFGGVETYPDLYLDETVSRMYMNLRGNYGRLAESLAAAGENEKAAEVIEHALKMMPDSKIPYNVFNASYPQFLYGAGKNAEAEKLIAELLAKAKDELKYWKSAYNAQLKAAQNSGDRAYISRLQQGAFLQNRPIQEQLYVMQELMNICKKYNPELGASLEKELRDSQTMFIPNA